MNIRQLLAGFAVITSFAAGAWASDTSLLCKDLHEEKPDSQLLCKKKGESCQSQDECCVGYCCNINGICIVF